MQAKQGNKREYYLLYLFMTGLLLGILFVNVRHDIWLQESGLLNSSMLEKLRESEFYGSYLFGYIAKHRIPAAAAVALLSSTMFGLLAICVYACYLGFSAGCLLTVAVVRYGIRGLFLMAASVFPQIFVYLPAYLLLFVWALVCNRTISGKMGITLNEGYYVSRKQIVLKNIRHFLLVLFLLLLGCLLESYVNPKILHFILNFF